MTLRRHHVIVYFQKTPYFLVFHRNIELKQANIYLLIEGIKISNVLKAKGWAKRNTLRLQKLCGRHSLLGELRAKIFPIFLPRFSLLFCLLSSRILQNNLLDLYLVEIYRHKFSSSQSPQQVLAASTCFSQLIIAGLHVVSRRPCWWCVKVKNKRISLLWEPNIFFYFEKKILLYWPPKHHQHGRFVTWLQAKNCVKQERKIIITDRWPELAT